MDIPCTKCVGGDTFGKSPIPSPWCDTALCPCGNVTANLSDFCRYLLVLTKNAKATVGTLQMQKSVLYCITNQNILYKEMHTL